MNSNQHHGIKSARIIGLADDIARSMESTSARISVLPGKNAIGIEIPNESRQIVFLRSLFESKEYQSLNHSLPLALGKDIGGEVVITDLARMPHLLVAGTTGSGKSVAINTMILSLIYHLPPEKCKLIMVDPKMLELSVYNDIPHLLAPVVTNPKEAISVLRWLVNEMERRYHLMAQLNVRNMDNYNQKIIEAQKNNEVLTRKIQTGFDKESNKPIIEEIEFELTLLPYIVTIIDEMADLMLVAGKEIESYIQRLAQMARASGIHLIVATQRPSVDVITGVIKANFPTRISFQVTSKIDSRTILGEQGAEQLLGKGDMLYMFGGSKIVRIHGAFVSDTEVEEVVKFLKLQGKPNYITNITNFENRQNNSADGKSSGDSGNMNGLFDNDYNESEDEMYKKAIDIVLQYKKVSISFIQRQLKIGYNRAANIVEQMEERGVVSAPNHIGRREILIGQEDGE